MLKKTDKGIYLNFESLLPEKYKFSVIKTLTHRAYKHCSDWISFDTEIKRITQGLINNNFPQKFIDSTINKHLTKLYLKKENKKEKTNFYLETFKPKNMVNDQKTIRKIFNEHIKSKNEQKVIDVALYYRPKKIETCFSTRLRRPDMERHNVVYQFTCNEESCNASYIGYTTNMLLTRGKQHKYAPSKINKHFKDIHKKSPDNTILEHFKIIYQGNNEYDIRIAECMLIKRNKPYINVKYGEISNF